MKNSLDRLITAKEWIAVLNNRTKKIIQAAQRDKEKIGEN